MSNDTYSAALSSDEQHMSDYARGDERAFSALYRSYAPRLRGYFVRKGKRPHDAEDLVQQTFLNLHRSRAGYRDGELLRPWLFTIARNLCRDHGRRQLRRPETFCELDQHEAEPLADGAVHGERLRALTLALDQLPGEHRNLLEQHWFEDRSFAEIADRDGSLAGTLRVRAHRACVQLRGLLDEHCAEAA